MDERLADRHREQAGIGPAGRARQRACQTCDSGMLNAEPAALDQPWQRTPVIARTGWHGAPARQPARHTDGGFADEPATTLGRQVRPAAIDKLAHPASPRLLDDVERLRRTLRPAGRTASRKNCHGGKGRRPHTICRAMRQWSTRHLGGHDPAPQAEPAIHRARLLGPGSSNDKASRGRASPSA